MEARDVMTTPVVTVGPDTPLDTLAKVMLKRRISAVPVVDASGRLQGIVSEGDLIRRSQGDSEATTSWWLSFFSDREQLAKEYTKMHGHTAADVMTRKVVTATENTPLDKIATLLERHQIKRVPIVSRGKVVGVVSRANLLHGLVAQKTPASKVSGKDREIRAQIVDELDKAGVDKGHVNVVVSKGVVELWGYVETPIQKRALGLAARGAKGMKKVVDNVIVVSPALRNVIAQ